MLQAPIVIFKMLLTSTACDGAREKVGLSPAMDDGLVVDVLDHAVRTTRKLHLQKHCSDIISISARLTLSFSLDRLKNRFF